MSNPDKLNKLIASVVNFSSGERLTSEKLNKLIEILDLNTESISGAVGDIYDANYVDSKYSRYGKQQDSNTPSTGAQKRRLDIANIARLIGPASNLNPRNQINSSRQIVETIPAGSTSFSLKYPVKEGTDPTVNPGYAKVTKGSLLVGRSYFIENNTVYLTEAPEGSTVTYTIMSSEFGGGPNYQGARFNVIPDPNQTSTKLAVTYSADVNRNVSYLIDMGGIVDQQSSLVDLQEDTTLDSKDINFGQIHLLPEWFYQIDNNETIPQYSLYLKNYSTNESYTNATYTKISNNQIRVSNLLLGNQDCVDDFDFRLITVGTDITTSIDDLRNKMFLHNHDGSFGEPKVSIEHIDSLYDVPAPSGIYAPSELAWNDIPSYLHRDGYQANEDRNNGSNAMRGSIMMGLKSFNPLIDVSDNPISLDGNTSTGVNDTHEILFGSADTKIEGSGTSNGVENLVNLALRNSKGNVLLQTSDDLSSTRNRDISLVSAANCRLTSSEDVYAIALNGLVNLNNIDTLKSYIGKDLLTSNNENLKNGFIKKVTSSKTAKEEDLVVYSIGFIDSGQYTLPGSAMLVTSEKFVDIFDIYDTNSSDSGWGNKYKYVDTSANERISNFLEVSNNFKVLDFRYFRGPSSISSNNSVDWNDNSDIVRFFCLGDKLNCIYDIDLLKNTQSVISPIWRMTTVGGNTRDYRNIDIEIFRGPAWLHQYKDELNVPGKVLKNEFFVNINSDTYVNLDPSINTFKDYDGGCHLILNYNFNYTEDSDGNITLDTDGMVPDNNSLSSASADLKPVPLQNTTNFLTEFGIKKVTARHNTFGYATNYILQEENSSSNAGIIKIIISSSPSRDGEISNSIKVTETYCNGTFYLDLTIG